MAEPPAGAAAGIEVVVLAAQRDGQRDPLAAQAGVSHKCLVPIAGKPLLAHVLGALVGVEGIASIQIAVEAGGAAQLAPVAEASGLPVRFTAAADNIADSVYAAAEGTSGALVVTTADNVLLTAAAVRQAADLIAAGNDVVIALARREDVLAAHPEGQRRFYRFRDGEYSNCNLYGLSRRGLKMAEAFRDGGQFAKNPWRIARAVGFVNLIVLRYGLVGLDRAFGRFGRRFGIKAVPLVLADGAHAIDVDNQRTYDIAAELLDRRAA